MANREMAAGTSQVVYLAALHILQPSLQFLNKVWLLLGSQVHAIFRTQPRPLYIRSLTSHHAEAKWRPWRIEGRTSDLIKRPGFKAWSDQYKLSPCRPLAASEHLEAGAIACRKGQVCSTALLATLPQLLHG